MCRGKSGPTKLNWNKTQIDKTLIEFLSTLSKRKPTQHKCGAEKAIPWHQTKRNPRFICICHAKEKFRKLFYSLSNVYSHRRQLLCAIRTRRVRHPHAQQQRAKSWTKTCASTLPQSTHFALDNSTEDKSPVPMWCVTRKTARALFIASGAMARYKFHMNEFFILVLVGCASAWWE